jgi:FMN phosphatase YigB (HAD superfamily)
MDALQLVLFDLDDTLFDHQYSRRCGLLALQQAYPSLASIPIETLAGVQSRYSQNLGYSETGTFQK